MSEPKPFASLSSGLLARKGAAKPAMRPQGFGQMGVHLEDLGWNDMGHVPQPAPYPQEMPEHVPSSIAALTPAPRAGNSADNGSVRETEREEEMLPPPVVEQQRVLEERFAPEPVQAPAPQPRVETPVAPVPEPVAAPVAVPVQAAVAKPPRARRAPGSQSKAAFTLRLDPERHLKLRLACAVTCRSAQQIVTDALDSFLDAHPELGSLASQVPGKLGKRR